MRTAYAEAFDAWADGKGKAALSAKLRNAQREKNRYFSNLRIVRSDGGDDRAFTSGDQADHTPRWAPDGGSVAFLADRGERAQLWRIRADGGEAEKLTSLDEGSIGEFRWSPGGDRIAFTYRPKPAWASRWAR